jgi:hypothetical protein
MQSWVDICNQALRLCGGGTIQSLGESSEEARHCALFLAPCRRSLLASHAWNRATAWANPPVMAEADKAGAPRWPYRYAFALPADCLRILRVETGLPSGSLATGAALPAPYQVMRWKEQPALICDLERPTLAYLADVPEPARISPGILDALVWLLASKLALGVAEAESRAGVFEQKYREALMAAMLADAREGYEAIPRDDTWLRERSGGF